MFRRKESKEVEDQVEQLDPQSAEDFLRRGWINYSKGENQAAEADFNQALSMNANLVDAQYGLGMNYKASGDHEQALTAYQKVLKLLEDGAEEDRIRADMLEKLTRVHLAQLSPAATT